MISLASRSASRSCWPGSAARLRLAPGPCPDGRGAHRGRGPRERGRGQGSNAPSAIASDWPTWPPGWARRRVSTGIDLEAVAYGALLHDVGKIGVPEAILTKPAPLDGEEWDLMRRHPEIGERICEPLLSAGSFAPIVRHHHERWDGRGYPDGLRGEAIPLGARIVGLVDAFDAMTHDRPYRRGMPIALAVNELWREAGGQFDRALVPLFVMELERDAKTVSSELPPSALLLTGVDRSAVPDPGVTPRPRGGRNYSS